MRWGLLRYILCLRIIKMPGEESRLLSKLKKNYLSMDVSDSNPIYWEIDLELSAEIFRKLGLIYMERNSSKLCLIRSATLFMAARVRSSNSQDFDDNLEKLWRVVQGKWKAKARYRSLNGISKLLMKQVSYMRLNVKRSINMLPELKFCMPNDKLLQMEKERLKK